MNTKELLELLKAHDVWYGYSDDPSAWLRGQRQFAVIESAAHESDENRKVFEEFFQKLHGENK